MKDGTSEGRWPGANEWLVVEEMRRDGYSDHWEQCAKFVEQIVSIRARNIPDSLREEIAQEILYKVAKFLPFFEFRCAFKTWLNLLAVNYIIDVYRKLQNRGQVFFLSDLVNEHDNEGDIADIAITNEVRSAESVFMMQDTLRVALDLLVEYVNIHSKPDRNSVIVQMVILDDYSDVEIAKVVGCSAAVVGYVVREARRYVRENMQQDF